MWHSCALLLSDQKIGAQKNIPSPKDQHVLNKILLAGKKIKVICHFKGKQQLSSHTFVLKVGSFWIYYRPMAYWPDIIFSHIVKVPLSNTSHITLNLVL